MIESILGLSAYLLANIYWIYKANKNHEFLKKTCTLSNPFRRNAESNLNMSLLFFLAGALTLIITLLGVPQ